MKVRALTSLDTPEGLKDIGDEFELPADKATELAELGWIEKVGDTKSAKSTKADKEAEAAAAKV